MAKCYASDERKCLVDAVRIRLRRTCVGQSCVERQELELYAQLRGLVAENADSFNSRIDKALARQVC